MWAGFSSAFRGQVHTRLYRAELTLKTSLSRWPHTNQQPPIIQESPCGQAGIPCFSRVCVQFLCFVVFVNWKHVFLLWLTLLGNVPNELCVLAQYMHTLTCSHRCALIHFLTLCLKWGERMFEQTKTVHLLALWPFAHVPWCLSKPAPCSFGGRFERKMEKKGWMWAETTGPCRMGHCRTMWMKCYMRYSYSLSVC